MKLKRIINSIILCIRFPFLYPRNRFSGLHKTNWKFSRYIGKLYSKSVKVEFIDGHIVKTITDYPLYIWHNILDFIHRWPYQLFFCIPTYTELDAMDKGWRKAFGIDICKEIKLALIRTVIDEENISKKNIFKYFKAYLKGIKLLYSYRIMQIKEKYGGLRWYDAWSPKSVQDIIDKYEDISFKTCISCGKPATKMTTGWISPYCDDCIGNSNYTDIN